MVALQSETRAEFYLTDIGIMTAGAISAALYTSLPYADQAKTLRASDATVVFVENEKVMKALQSEGLWMCSGFCLPTIRCARLGERKMREDPAIFERIRAEVSESDLAVLYIDVRRYGRAEDGAGFASGVGGEYGYVSDVVSFVARGLHHCVSALGAYRAASGGRTAADPRRRLHLVF